MGAIAICRKIGARVCVCSASWLRGSYARALENEIVRLRAENRALVNSILGVAGIPPTRVRMVGSGFSPDRTQERRGLAQTSGGPEGRPYQEQIEARYPTRRSISDFVAAAFRPAKSRKTGASPRCTSAPSHPVGATLGSPGRGESRPYDGPTADDEVISHAAPLRKRSWQQIGRAREIQDARTARRERETDTQTFPAPRSVVLRV